jgi:hypothetical protein
MPRGIHLNITFLPSATTLAFSHFLKRLLVFLNEKKNAYFPTDLTQTKSIAKQILACFSIFSASDAGQQLGK